MKENFSRKNFLFRYIWNIFGFLVFILLGWYIYQNQDIFKYIHSIEWKQVLLIILLDLISFFVNSLLDWSMINRLHHGRVSFWDCYFLGYANSFLNKILPTIGGGAAFRAAFLKKKYDFSYSHFISTISGLYIISFFSTSLMGLCCMVWIYLNYRVFNGLVMLIFLGILLFCLFVILFSPHIPQHENQAFQVLNNVFDGWRVIKKEPRFIVLYASLAIVFLLLAALQTLISYEAIDVETNFVSMLFLSTLGIIQAFLNFTPDGIGVREGLFVFSSSLVQIPGNVLVLGSLVLRAVSFCTTFVIGGICYAFLARQFKGRWGEKDAIS